MAKKKNNTIAIIIGLGIAGYIGWDMLKEKGQGGKSEDKPVKNPIAMPKAAKPLPIPPMSKFIAPRKNKALPTPGIVRDETIKKPIKRKRPLPRILKPKPIPSFASSAQAKPTKSIQIFKPSKPRIRRIAPVAKAAKRFSLNKSMVKQQIRRQFSPLRISGFDEWDLMQL